MEDFNLEDLRAFAWYAGKDPTSAFIARVARAGLAEVEKLREMGREEQARADTWREKFQAQKKQAEALLAQVDRLGERLRECDRRIARARAELEE